MKRLLGFFWALSICAGEIALPERGICAHRGAQGTYPENSLSAIKEPVKLGVHMIEIDLHLTKDNHVVLMHDTSTGRTANKDLRVRGATLAEIRELEFKKLPGEGIPTFEEVLDVIPLNMWIELDMKARGPEGLALGKAVLKILQDRQRTHQIVLACGPQVGAFMRKPSPELLYLHVDNQLDGSDYLAKALANKAKFVMLRSERKPTAELMARLKEHDLKSNYYYTRTTDHFANMIRAGVEFPYSGDIRAALAACKSLGIAPVTPIFTESAKVDEK